MAKRALYRVVKRLWTGRKFIQPGCVGCLKHLTDEQVAELVRVGAIAEVYAPPLVELPKWQSRVEKLARGGIIDLADVVLADVEVLASLGRVRPATAARWQAEAETTLTMTPKEGCCGG